MTERRVNHREFLELLPWYVNGTLGDAERERLERHLGSCLPCNAILREERKIGAMLRGQDTVPLGPDHGLNALNSRIDRRDHRGRQHRRVRSSPGLGLPAAIAAGAAIVFVWLGSMAPDDDTDGEFATLTTVAADAPGDIDVVFAAAEVTEAALAGFISEFELRLVSGPTALGRYTFAVAGRDASVVNRLLETLAADPRVRFAGRAFIGDGDGDGGDSTEGAR